MINRIFNAFFKKYARYEKFFAFSLVELMISLITISCIVAAFTPVITKKLKKQDIAISIAQTSEIFSPCKWNPSKGDAGEFERSANEAEPCRICTKLQCITCNLDCDGGTYAEPKICECKNCNTHPKIAANDLTKTNCVTCDSAGCVKCDNDGANEGKYYVVDITVDASENEHKNDTHLCNNCGDAATYVCNGTERRKRSDCKATENSGYFCENGIKKACAQKYDTHCVTCNATKCLSCVGYYALNENGTCLLCSRATKVGSCVDCSGCKADGTCSSCDSCAGGTYYDGGQCYNCGGRHANCLYCSKDQCNQCNTGYYLTSSHKCEQCNKEHCKKCEDNKTNYCISCTSGYYLYDGNCYPCTNYDGRCVACTGQKCLSCEPGWHLESNGKCALNNGAWNCSEADFMQVGDICVTRRNMGDSGVLAIPAKADVMVVNVGETCYATRTSCCWKPDNNLSNGNCYNWPSTGSYDACKRTVCDFDAAKKICDNFNYLGVKWRLPTVEEARSFDAANFNLGDNGLMIGSGTAEGDAPYSQSNYGCYGSTAYEQLCYRYLFYASNGNNTASSIGVASSAIGVKSLEKYDSSTFISYASTFSVRCVTEMSNFK